MKRPPKIPVLPRQIAVKTARATARPKLGSLTYERWYNGFWPGYPFGIVILLFTLAYFCVEVSRIFTGTLNRNPLYSYGLYPGNIYFPPYFSPTNSYNVERQNHYIWPWSSPALLFSIFFLLSSLFALTAARRGTYSMIYLFYTFTLLSALILPFLIAYYSTDIHRFNAGQVNWHTLASADRDRSLSIVMLCLSVVMLPLFVIALLFGACAFDCCWPKGGSYYKPVMNQNQVASPPITRTTAI